MWSLCSRCKSFLKETSLMPSNLTPQEREHKSFVLQEALTVQHLASSLQKGDWKGPRGIRSVGEQEEDRGRNQGWPVGQIKLLPACISHPQVSRGSTAAEYKWGHQTEPAPFGDSGSPLVWNRDVPLSELSERVSKRARETRNLKGKRNLPYLYLTVH